MTKTTMQLPVTPEALRNGFRERLIEDLFVGFYKHVAHEDTLRGMAAWLSTTGIFADQTVMELWLKQPQAHSQRGQDAFTKWSRLNQAAEAIANEVKVDAEH